MRRPRGPLASPNPEPGDLIAAAAEPAGLDAAAGGSLSFQHFSGKSVMSVESDDFQLLNSDQQRESVNTRQKFDHFLELQQRSRHYRGSMTFASVGGTAYLLRSYYDPKTGLRRQTSLGVRDEANERVKADFELGRATTRQRLADARTALNRQAGLNRVLGLGRVPDLAARIIRSLDAAGLLGRGLRIVGTYAIFAYEAAAGVRLPADLATTEDVDLLFDARASLTVLADDSVGERSLMALLKRVDSSFDRMKQSFRAANRDGFMVDLIRPLRSPPWAEERRSVGEPETDLEAVQIEGLLWNESAPAFEAVAVDTRGFPVRIETVDPRSFVVHKLWTSRRDDRPAVQRLRDAAQARAVATLVSRFLPHLRFEPATLRHLPKAVVTDAEPLFGVHGSPDTDFTWP